METWILITVAAAFVQNIRSGLQKHLRGQMGTAGATFVRFGFGVPFAFIFLILAVFTTQSSLPAVHGTFFGWVILAALAQIFGQVLLITLFTMRNFAVGSAYIRIEPVLAAVFGFVLLFEAPTLPLIVAVMISVVGVLMITMAQTHVGIWSLATAVTKREAQIGLASAAMFGLAAVGFRGASLSLGGPNFIVQGGFTLCAAITLQAIVMALWIAVKDPADFKRIAAKWKTSLMVGFVGALASFGWFTAMTLEQAAAVKAVAQIEMLFAFVASYFVFKERMNKREIIGCLLIVCGVLVLALMS